MQVRDVGDDQHIHLAGRGGTHQIHHSGPQRDRLFLSTCLGEQLKLAGPEQLAQGAVADELLLALGQVGVFGFLDKADGAHDMVLLSLLFCVFVV